MTLLKLRSKLLSRNMSDAEDSCVLQNGDEATGCQPLPVVNCAQQPNVRLCDICRLRASLYTFKCCTWRCCGPDCYAVHCKTNLERDAKAVETAATVEVGKCAPCGGPSHAPLGVLSKRRATRQNVQQERSCSNDDDAIVLTEKQKKSLGSVRGSYDLKRLNSLCL